jgi:hypothetical protein
MPVGLLSKSSAAELVLQGADLGLMGLDALGGTELDHGTLKIVTWATDLGIDVAFKIIGEEPQSQLEWQQSDGVVEVFNIVIAERRTRFEQVPPQHRRRQIKIKTDGIKIGGLIASPIAARTKASPMS